MSYFYLLLAQNYDLDFVENIGSRGLIHLFISFILKQTHDEKKENAR